MSGRLASVLVHRQAPLSEALASIGGQTRGPKRSSRAPSSARERQGCANPQLFLQASAPPPLETRSSLRISDLSEHAGCLTRILRRRLLNLFVEIHGAAS